MGDDVVARIEKLTQCAYCGNPLRDLASLDFCSQICQGMWQRKNNGETEGPQSTVHPLGFSIVVDDPAGSYVILPDSVDSAQFTRFLLHYMMGE